jgi:hypothetical protein
MAFVNRHCRDRVGEAEVGLVGSHVGDRVRLCLKHADGLSTAVLPVGQQRADAVGGSQLIESSPGDLTPGNWST